MALRLKVNWSPSVTRRLAVATHTGGWFCSATMTSNSWATLATPSDTLILTRLVLGPCASVGRQDTAPLVVTTKPVGPFTRR